MRNVEPPPLFSHHGKLFSLLSTIVHLEGTPFPSLSMILFLPRALVASRQSPLSYLSRRNSTIMLCMIMHSVMIFLIFSLCHILHGCRNICNRDARTPKALYTSFRTDSCAVANRFCFLGITPKIVSINIAPFRYMPHSNNITT